MSVDFFLRLLPLLVLGGFALVKSRLYSPRRMPTIAAAVIACGALTRLEVSPLAKLAASSFLAMMMVSRPAEFFQPPYGLGMLIVIYGTFLEPTIAAYVMAKLSLGALPQNSLFRLLSFATLVLGAAGASHYFW